MYTCAGAIAGRCGEETGAELIGHPATLLEASTYTPDGRRASFAEANGNATLYCYDGFDRLQTGSQPVGTPQPATTIAPLLRIPVTHDS